jgi:hypothetical protein
MAPQRFYRDKEGAFYAADGLHSRADVWKNEQHQYRQNIGYGGFAMKPEYVGRFSAASGGIRRFSDQYPQRAYHNIPQPAQRSLPYYPHGYLPQHYPILMNGDQRRAIVKKKHSSKTAQKRQRSSAQFFPGVAYPNPSQQYYTHYRNAFPSSPSSPIQNQGTTSPNYLTYQQSVGIDEAVNQQNYPNYFNNVGRTQQPVWYKNETDLANTFASRFTRDNRPYYVSEEKTRGESRKYEGYGNRYFSNSIDEVEEEIERNVQDISSDLENYKNEIILRPPGSRAGLAISRPISRIENSSARPTSRNEAEKQGPKYNNMVQTCDISEHPGSPSWTTQLASILRSKQEKHGANNKMKPSNIKHNTKPPAQHTQVIHKFLPDATFGIARQIVETDDHAFNDFECNCNGCSDGNGGPLPEDNRSNLGHSYYNLLDDGNGHFEHDSNNNRIELDRNSRNSDKLSSLNAASKPEFDARNVPKLR